MIGIPTAHWPPNSNFKLEVRLPPAAFRRTRSLGLGVRVRVGIAAKSKRTRSRAGSPFTSSSPPRLIVNESSVLAQSAVTTEFGERHWEYFWS